MNRKDIPTHVLRKLYAESMGRCMNPSCQKELFTSNGDIVEKAHIDAYSTTEDNSFDNLVILCPNCHTNFDKNHAFSAEELKQWKHIRQQELDTLFNKKFSSFEDLKQEIAPLLRENKTIFENYYLNDRKSLWEKFEIKLLTNNRKIKTLLENNLHLIQSHTNKDYSNLAIVSAYLLHIEEFEKTRGDEEKVREVLFPTEINSIFGIEPVNESLLPMTEAFEALIQQLKLENKFVDIYLGSDEPYILIQERGIVEKLLLFDTPRVRQFFYNYKCFSNCRVRFECLNFALKYIRNHQISFTFPNNCNLREIDIDGVRIVFIYKYCLSKIELQKLSPKEGSVVVNLHNWNGQSCISREAYIFSQTINVKLLTMEDFYEYISKKQYKK